MRWAMDALMPDMPTLSIPGRRLGAELVRAFKAA